MDGLMLERLTESQALSAAVDATGLDVVRVGCLCCGFARLWESVISVGSEGFAFENHIAPLSQSDSIKGRETLHGAQQVGVYVTDVTRWHETDVTDVTAGAQCLNS